MSGYSKACCTIPPVVTDDYTPKGQYHEFNGMKTYVTGPADASKAVFMIYDIFGFKDQILQGADIIAFSDDKKPYQVYMPDLFEGNVAKIEWYPPDTEEKQKILGKWFEGAAPPKHLPKIAPLLDAFEKNNSHIKSWGIIGYCWGGKMVSLIGGKETRFKAGLQTSPAMVDPEDAKKVQIPMAMLASKEEPADKVAEYESSLTVKKHIETFDDQLHGFMSARADLKDDNVKKEYERGYTIAINWFHEHL